jgi:hypothetical protein
MDHSAMSSLQRLEKRGPAPEGSRNSRPLKRCVGKCHGTSVTARTRSERLRVAV